MRESSRYPARSQLLPLLAEQRLPQLCGRLLLHALQRVAVDVESHGNGCVTQALGDDLGVKAQLESKRRVSVAQIVQSDARQSRAGHTFRKELGNSIGVKGRSVVEAEHQIITSLLGATALVVHSSLEMVGQHLNRCFVECYPRRPRDVLGREILRSLPATTSD